MREGQALFQVIGKTGTLTYTPLDIAGILSNKANAKPDEGLPSVVYWSLEMLKQGDTLLNASPTDIALYFSQLGAAYGRFRERNEVNFVPAESPDNSDDTGSEPSVSEQQESAD